MIFWPREYKNTDIAHRLVSIRSMCDDDACCVFWPREYKNTYIAHRLASTRSMCDGECCDFLAKRIQKQISHIESESDQCGDQKNCAISQPPKLVWIEYSHWGKTHPHLLNHFSPMVNFVLHHGRWSKLCRECKPSTQTYVQPPDAISVGV